MKRRLVAVTLSLIMTMATVSEAGAAAFTSPDTAPAVATQTDVEEVNVTEETSETGTSETEADAFSDGDDGTAVPSQEQTDDAFTAGTDTAAALPDETPSTADATDAVGAAVVKAEDWVSTENGFKLRKPAKIRIQQIQMIRKQQQQHYPMRRCRLRLTDSQEIRQNHLKQQWLKQIQQL